jgi:DNA-binding transcriptional regulator YiaG
MMSEPQAIVTELTAALTEFGDAWTGLAARGFSAGGLEAAQQCLYRVAACASSMQMWREARMLELEQLRPPITKAEVGAIRAAVKGILLAQQSLEYGSSVERELSTLAGEMLSSLRRRREAAGLTKRLVEYKQKPPRSDFLDNPPNRMRELRLYAGLKQRDVADGIGVSVTYVSTWERKGGIPEDRQAAIAEFFGVTVDDLLTAGPTELTLPEDWS